MAWVAARLQMVQLACELVSARERTALATIMKRQLICSRASVRAIFTQRVLLR